MRTQRGKLVATPFGKSMLSTMRGRGAYRRPCSILRSGTWISVFRPRAARLMAPDGMALCRFRQATEQSSEKLTRLCTIPEPATLSETWDRTPYAMEARICERYSGLGSSNIVAKRYQATDSASSTSKFSEARLYDLIHEPQGVRFGPFRLDLEQRPHADRMPEKN